MTQIVVVGGGLAGVSAALAAADHGADVVLVEAHAVLGGRTRSFQRGRHTFDNGQHVFLRCCTGYRTFLDRIGAADRVQLQPRLDIPVLASGRKPARLRSSPLPPPAHLVASLSCYRHLRLAERARLGNAALALRKLDPTDPALDDQTFGDWLVDHRQSTAAIHRLWDLIVRPAINLPATEASLALAAKVFRTGLLDDPAGADVGWAKVPLSHLHSDAATAALRAAGVDVRLRSRVGAVMTTPERAHGVAIIGADRRRNSESLHADAVVLAVPPDRAARLLRGHVTTHTTERLLELGTSPIVNVHLVLDRRVTDLPFAAAVDSPVQFLFDRSAAVGVAPGHQCLVSSLSAATREIHLSAHLLIDEQLAAITELFPRMRHASVVDAVVTREPTATFRGVPGTAAARPSHRTELPGLILAGSWTATGWPDTMESAVRSGHAAAAAAMGDAIIESPAKAELPA